MTEPWSLAWSVGIFVLAAGLTVVCSVLVALGDTLADRTGRRVTRAFMGAFISSRVSAGTGS